MRRGSTGRRDAGDNSPPYRLLSIRENGAFPIQFDTVSQKCRNQLLSIFYGAMQDLNAEERDAIIDEIRFRLGLEPITVEPFFRSSNDLKKTAKDLDDSQFKDMVDAFCHIFREISESDRHFDYPSFAEDVDEVLKENGLGYKVNGGQLVKYLDETEYEAIVKPGLEILSNKGFEASYDYMTKAFESYKQGNNSNALVETTMALESTIDALAIKMGIQLEKRSKLNSKINVLLENGLCPRYNESFLSSLGKMLSESSARNNEGAHSKEKATEVDDTTVQYAMDQTLSSILFLIRSYNNLCR